MGPTLPTLLGVAALAGATAWWLERRRGRATSRRLQEEIVQQRRRHGAELREQTERTTALFDRMIEGVVVLDAGGRIRFANAAAGALFGFAPPAIGRTLLEATRQHEVSAVVARLDGQAEVIGHEMTLESATAPRFLQVNALALRDAAGARDGVILVFHDLTNLRRLEAVRQEFVANVSHELRTPLSLIKSAAETLIDGGKDDPAALTRFLEIIDKHANRLTFLIEDLLLLSSLDSGRLRMNLRTVVLAEAVQEVADELAGRAKAKRVTVDNRVADGLAVRADGQRLHQVLANLLDNAIKYGRDSGRVEVSARALPDGWIEVAVRDDGPGLPAEAKARVFERFYRQDKARSRDQGGTGLGLAIVKHVVQAHDGDVRVESEPGQGATFFFTLRAAGPEPGDPVR